LLNSFFFFFFFLQPLQSVRGRLIDTGAAGLSFFLFQHWVPDLEGITRYHVVWQSHRKSPNSERRGIFLVFE